MKGTALFSEDCSGADMLNLDWCYICPRTCAAEYVYYLETPSSSGIASSRTMFYNEPEFQNWTLSQMISSFRDYAKRYPGVTWIGPCVAYDLNIAAQFWRDYWSQPFATISPQQVRLCVHCYESIEACVARIERAGELARQLGLPSRSIWFTEFGRPLGAHRTMAEHIAETRQLINYLEASPLIEAYAYWPALYWPLPTAPDPTTSYVPLLYVIYYPGGSRAHPVGYRMTEMGKEYAK